MYSFILLVLGEYFGVAYAFLGMRNFRRFILYIIEELSVSVCVRVLCVPNRLLNHASQQEKLCMKA